MGSNSKIDQISQRLQNVAYMAFKSQEQEKALYCRKANQWRLTNPWAKKIAGLVLAILLLVGSGIYVFVAFQKFNPAPSYEPPLPFTNNSGMGTHPSAFPFFMESPTIETITAKDPQPTTYGLESEPLQVPQEK